ncbi:hypothetical protein [Streptomyces phaeochromogenes]|uniref:hypothetical protein n=1 Tax=Streptomyces phaeochromogenes TaxID=1923 RepID=UPI0037192557
MPRKYTVSDKVIERNRKGGSAPRSLDSYIQRIVDRAPELTEANYAKLRTIGLRLDGGAAE